MALYAEIWARPGAPTFGRVIDFIPNPYQTFHDGMNIVGDGVLQVPNTFDRFDEILLIDEATPSNCVSSLVRIFDDSDPDNPIFEWLPSAILPTTDKFDPNIDISGEGIKSIMKYARVEAFDWDGSLDFECSDCDWVYGGENILSNGDFEDSTPTPNKWALEITATGGTYTLTDGTDTTSAIAFDAIAGTLDNRLEADIAAIIDISIVSTATSPRTFIIAAIDPPIGFTLAVNTGSLTGGTATLTAIVEGELRTQPWTIASSLADGAPKDEGSMEDFGISTAQNHTPGGQYSLLIDPSTPAATSNRNGGAQQVVSVTPGSLFQASVWIYPTSGTDEFRLGLFSIGNELLASNNPSGVTLTPNTWNELITDFTVPDNVSQLLFRVQSTNLAGNNPSVFYIDDAELRPGQNAATVGKIIGDLYDDAVSNHAGRIVWEDESNPGNPYLTLDFTDTVDSAGNAWTHPEIEVKLWMRMTYLQVLDQFVQTYGYEWRVVPNDVEAGTWYLQIYNPGGMQTDYTTAASPGIQTGSRDTRRSVRRFVPSGTQYLVEGTNRITGRDEDTDLSTALGRIETSRISRQLPSLDSVGDAAFEDKTDALVNGLTYTYELTDPIEVPLSDYLIGDALHIEDPPEVSDNARLIDVECVVSPNATEFEVQFSPQTAAGS